MARDQEQLSLFPFDLRENLCGHGKAFGELAVFHARPDPLQRINDGVSRDEDLFRRDALAQEVLSGARGGGKVQISEMVSKQPIDLLGEGTIFVVSAQPGLDARQGDLRIVRTQRSHKRRRGIPLGDDDVGAFCAHDSLKGDQGVRSELIEALIGAHEVQVIVGGDLEDS
jgi:hypothetical protein